MFPCKNPSTSRLKDGAFYAPPRTYVTPHFPKPGGLPLPTESGPNCAPRAPRSNLCPSFQPRVHSLPRWCDAAATRAPGTPSARPHLPGLVHVVPRLESFPAPSWRCLSPSSHRPPSLSSLSVDTQPRTQTKCCTSCLHGHYLTLLSSPSGRQTPR